MRSIATADKNEVLGGAIMIITKVDIDAQCLSLRNFIGITSGTWCLFGV
jgi:hypothetical protein